MSQAETNEGSKPGEAAPVPLDFEAWAALSARLLQLEDEERFDVLAEAEVEPDDYVRCDAHWSVVIARDIAAGSMARAEVYGAKCAEELKRRAEAKDAPAAVTSLAAAAAPPPAPAAVEVPDEITAPITAPKPAGLPSFLAAPPVAPVAAPAPVAPPVAVAPPVSPLDVSEEEEQRTMAAVFPSPGSPAPAPLPFSSTPSPEFVKNLSAPRAVPVREQRKSLDSTVPANMMSPIPEALPFAHGAPAAAPPPKVPQMTLQAYASLCAELSVTPEKSAEVLRRYGVHDEHARRALDEEWRARLAAHPPSNQEWQKLYTTYRDWLRRKT